MQTFARWVTTPENRAAQLAVERVARCVCAGRQRRLTNPLYLVGPTGIGKSHLASALANRIARQSLNVVITTQEARDIGLKQESEGEAELLAARQADLLVIENIHQLRETACEQLVRLIDERLARQLQTVITAIVGPAYLANLPRRVTSRLSAGLVVEMGVWTISSRLAFLRDRASRRQLAVGEEVIRWLAEHADGSPRQLQGAIHRVETLAKVHRRVPDVDLVAAHFQAELETKRPSVERIVSHVSSYFHVTPDQLQSRHRHRHALLPRQVGMYLARQLTGLSLKRIGFHFGGRDHSTVLHACRKVEGESKLNATLRTALRQLHARLT